MTRAISMAPLSRTARNILALSILLAACSKDNPTSPPVVKVASVAVTPGTATLGAGGTVQLSASVHDSSGAPLTGRTISWSSGSTAVATVSATGLVTGVGGGVATISATSEGKIGTATITVATVFNPTASTTLTGTQRYTSVSIPAGVVITVTGTLDLSASGPIAIAGTLSGNCMGISVTGDSATTVTGTIDNSCADPTAAGVNLTIVGQKGISVSGATIKSTGNVLLTNDTTLTPADFPTPALLLGGLSAASVAQLGSRNEVSAAAAAGPDCSFSGDYALGPAAPAPPPGEALFLSGAAGKRVRAWCRGNGQMGGPPTPARPAGGATISAQDGSDGQTGTSVSNIVAEARAGDGGTGGDVQVYATGDLTFIVGGPVILNSGSGGNGGVATATGLPNLTLIRGTNAFATGGVGGAPGLVDIRVGGAITIAGPLALNINIGHGGDGGSGTAKASNGNDAGTSAAQAGGDASATGGQGGNTPKETLTARGAVFGAPVVTGGNAGNGGAANATAGKGGNGNQAFPTGGRGGSAALNTLIAGNGISAYVGNGGNAKIRNLNLAGLIGRGGDGGAGMVAVGMGGQGWNGCPLNPGGAGGAGGSATGRSGMGGTGSNILIVNGDIDFEAFGNGGNGGDGFGPGAGGAAGSDATTVSFPGLKVNKPSSFIPGVAGNPCPPVHLTSRITVATDSNGHEPFVRYTTVTSLTETIEGNNLTITGAAPWVAVTGTIGATGNFTATGSGTVAGYPNVPAKVVGTIAADGTIMGTIQLGQATPPTGLPNGPVTYNLTTTRP